MFKLIQLNHQNLDFLHKKTFIMEFGLKKKYNRRILIFKNVLIHVMYL
jgi:hypothetical protein